MSARLKEKLASADWAKRAASALAEELERAEAAGALVIPAEPGGWWHQYVCPEHDTELRFDPLERDAQQFRCPHGCAISGEAYRGAWLVFKHQSLARYTLQAAALYAAEEEPRWRELARRLLVDYAAQFPAYPVHPDAQPWMLKGRAFHQALTEAIWATTLLRAYLLLTEEGVAFSEAERATLDRFMTLLANSMTEYRHILIHERGNPENNYTAWLNAALACVYAAQGDREALLGLLAGEGGWRHHLAIGVKPDQFEFEGSTYYHIFVLRAYLIAAEMAERFGIDLYGETAANGVSMKGMFAVLAALADDQGVLPALHDGPMARLPFAREIAEVMEAGLSRYRLPGLRPILAEAYRQMGSPDGERCELEALLYGEAERLAMDAEAGARGSLLLPDSGFAIGRRAGSALSFLADFGPHGGSHGHYDKLHVTIAHREGAFTPEFGMVPYGSALRKGWYVHTASHNTVAIGGASQAEHAGRCVRYADSAEATAVWLRSDGAYPGCRLDRHLLLTDDWLLDWFEVELDRPERIDWSMHPVLPSTLLSGELRPNGAEAAMDAAGPEADRTQAAIPGSYEKTAGRYVPAAGAEGAAQLTFVYPLPSGGRVFHTALLPDGDEAFAVETPGASVDPSARLTAYVQRRTDRRARFIHLYSSGSAIAAELAQDGDGTLRIEAGTGHVFVRLDNDDGLVMTRGE